MVSNARLDLPEPDRPVNTISASRGRSRLTSRRLCSRAPRTIKRSATGSQHTSGGSSDGRHAHATCALRQFPAVAGAAARRLRRVADTYTGEVKVGGPADSPETAALVNTE